MKSNPLNLRFFTDHLPLLAALAATIACASFQSIAADKTVPAAIEHYNLGADKVALKGYDPVGYLTKNQALKANKEISAQYRGVTYYFASEENKKLFSESPAKYVPGVRRLVRDGDG